MGLRREVESRIGKTGATPIVEGGTFVIDEALPDRNDRMTGLLRTDTHISRASTLWGGFTAAAVTVASTLSGHEVAALSFLVVSVAFAFSGKASVVANLPVAFLSVLFTTLVAWSAAAWYGADAFSSTLVARVFLVGMTAVAAGVIVCRRRAVATARLATRAEWIGCLPAAALGCYGAITALLPVAVGSNWFLLSADSTSHLLIATELRSAGRLDYGANPYPRGWHAVVATLESASGQPIGSPDALLTSIRISSLATWFLYVLLVLVTTLYSQRLARAVNLSERNTAFVGIGAGTTMLTASFFTFTMAMGFQTTILLAFLLLLSAHVLAAPGSTTWTYVTASMSFVAVAHTWQMGLTVAAVPWASSLRSVCGAHARPRQRVWAVVLTGATCALALSPLWAVATRVGLKQAAVWGGIGRLPVEWLIVGVVSYFVVRRHTASPAADLLGGMAVAAVITGLLVAWRVHTPLSSYYPRKMFWHASAFAVPLASIAVALIASSNGRRQAQPASRALKIAAFLAAGAYGVLAVVTPLMAIAGRWNEEVKQTLATVTRPDARQAQVTWKVTPDSASDPLAQQLLGFYSVSEGLPVTSGPRGHAEACARLRASVQPAVLTGATQEEVSREFRCVPSVRAVPSRSATSR